MELNGIACASFEERANEASWLLQGATMEGALALDGQELALSEDGEVTRRWPGYRVVSVGLEGGLVRLRAAIALDPKVEEAVSAAQSAVDGLRADVDGIESALTGGTGSGIGQLRAAAALAVRSLALSDGDAAGVLGLLPEWAEGGSYRKDGVVTLGGRPYRVLQDVAGAQAGHEPGKAPSLYAEIELAPDGVRVWRQPTGAHDAFALGEECHWPGADGALYRSKLDGNSWEPAEGGNDWWEPAE